MVKNLVSVIIPVYNSQKTILCCLEAVSSSSYSPIEIIVVNDASRDKTFLLAQQFADTHKDVKVISITHKGPAGARNAGAKIARGEYLFFLDSDVYIHSNTIEKLFSKARLNNKTSICLRIVPCDTENYFSILEDMIYKESYGMIEGLQYALPTANMLVPRVAYEAVSGFDESFLFPGAEDYDFCFRMIEAGYFLLYCPNVTVYHNHARTFKALARHAFVYGQEAIFLYVKRGASRHWLSVFMFYCFSACHSAVFSWRWFKDRFQWGLITRECIYFLGLACGCFCYVKKIKR